LNESEEFKENIGFEEYVDMSEGDEYDDEDEKYGYFSNLTDDEKNC